MWSISRPSDRKIVGRNISQPEDVYHILVNYNQSFPTPIIPTPPTPTPAHISSRLLASPWLGYPIFLSSKQLLRRLNIVEVNKSLSYDSGCQKRFRAMQCECWGFCIPTRHMSPWQPCRLDQGCHETSGWGHGQIRRRKWDHCPIMKSVAMVR